MTNTTTLSIQVYQDDIAFIYKLLSEYHADRDGFKAKCLEALDSNNCSYRGNDGKDMKENKEEKEGISFYEHVVKNCDCGTCLTAFARPTRTPWRWHSKGRYVNAEYGVLTIDCVVGDSDISGYIYQSPQVAAAKMNNAQILLKTAKIKSDVEMTKKEEEAADLKLEKSKTENRLKLSKEQSKVRDEISELNSKLSSVEKEHNYLYHLQSAPEFNRAKFCKTKGRYICSFTPTKYEPVPEVDDKHLFCQPCWNTLKHPRLNEAERKEREERIKQTQTIAGVWHNPLDGERERLRQLIRSKKDHLAHLMNEERVYTSKVNVEKVPTRGKKGKTPIEAMMLPGGKLQICDSPSPFNFSSPKR